MSRNACSSAYIVKCIDLWHGRLSHVNYASIKRLRHMKLNIFFVNVDNFSKYAICIEAKYAKKLFKPVTSRQKNYYN